MKSAAVRAVTGSGVARLFRPLTRSAAIVFMLHRFTDGTNGVEGYDPSVVRRLLAHLRRERHQLVDLRTLFAALDGEGPPLRHAVAFTIDDGYAEQATIAGALFAEFDCPVTTFVTSGFLDGEVWFWWDQIEYVLLQTSRPCVRLELGDTDVEYALGDAESRRRARADFIARCKRLRDRDKWEAIRRLALAAEVSVPRAAPPPYAPMTWAQLRASERMGMTFAPHTVTHPILARTDDAQARWEIVESWARLRSEAIDPIAVFAYPNGQPGDFGPREFGILKDAGLRGGVTGVAGFATSRHVRAPDGAFLVPRFPFPDSVPYLEQQVNGLERLKFLLRGMDWA